MSKRLVEIDDEVLSDAQQALGTSTIKETVNAALVGAVAATSRQAVDMEALRKFGEAAQDLRDPAVMAAAWE